MNSKMPDDDWSVEAVERLLDAPSWKARRRRRGRLQVRCAFREPLLWGRRFYSLTYGVTATALMVVLVAAVLLGSALLERGIPPSWRTFVGLGGILLALAGTWGVMLLIRWAVRKAALPTRRAQSSEAFLDASPQLLGLRPEFVMAVRESIASAYGVEAELIHADDTYRSLSRVSPFSQPFANEILAGTVRRLHRSANYTVLARRLATSPYPKLKSVQDVVLCFHRVCSPPDEGASSPGTS
jgi:hypothetical protein